MKKHLPFNWQSIILFVGMVLINTPLASQDNELILPFGHDTRITSMTFSTSGKYLITGDLDGWIKVWELSTGVPISTIKAHESEVSKLSFISELKYCSIGEDGILKQWKIGNVEPLQKLGSWKRRIKVLGFSNIKKQALVFYEKDYQILELENFKFKKSISNSLAIGIPSQEEITYSYCSSDLNYFAFVTKDRFGVIDLKNNKIIFTKEHEGGIKGGIFSKDNRFLAFNEANQLVSVSIYDLKKEEIIQSLQFRELIPNRLHVDNVDQLGFLNGNSNFLVTAGMDQKIRLWDILSGQEITNYIPQDMAEPKDGELIWGLSKLGPGGVSLIVIAPNDEFFVSATKKTLSTWVLRSFIQKSKTSENNNDITNAQFHNDKKTATVAFTDGKIATLNIRTGDEINTIKRKGKPVGFLKHTNNNFTISRLENGIIERYKDIKGESMVTIEPKEKEYNIDANDKYVITASVYQRKPAIVLDTFVNFWSVKTGKHLFKIPAFSSGTHQICLSENGNYLAVAGYTKEISYHGYNFFRTKIRIWSIKEKKIISEVYFDSESLIPLLRFSKDGNRLIVLAGERSVLMIDTGSGARVFEMGLGGRTPIASMDDRKKGNISFIKLSNAYPIEKNNQAKVRLRDMSGRNRRDVLIPLPENINEKYPVKEQILVGYKNGGVLVLDLELTLLDLSQASTINKFPYDPYHPRYYLLEEKFQKLHNGVALDAQYVPSTKNVISISTDSQLKQSAFSFNEENIPVLKQWNPLNPISHLRYSSTNDELVVGKSNGEVLRWNIKSPDPLHFYKIPQSKIQALAIDNQRNWIASCDIEGNANLVNLQTEKSYILDEGNPYTKTNFEWFLFSPDGNFLLGSAHGNDIMFLWDVKNKKFIREVRAGSPISDVRFSNNSQQILVSYDDYEPNDDKEKYNLNFYNIESGDFTRNIRNNKEYVHSIFSYEGKEMAWFVNGEELMVKDISSLEPKNVLTTKLPKIKVEQFHLMENGNHWMTVEAPHAYLLIEGSGKRVEVSEDEYWKLGRQNLLKDKTYLDKQTILRAIPRVVKIYNQNGKVLKEISLLENHEQVEIVNDSIILIKNQNDLFQWINVQENKTKLNVYFPNEGEFIAYVPNYYYASKKVTPHLFTSNGMKAFGFEQFDIKSNRPDLVLQSIDKQSSKTIKLYKAAYEKRLEKMGIQQESVEKESSVPEIKLLSKVEKVITKESQVSIKFMASTQIGYLNSILVSVNGVPIHGKHGINISQEKKKEYTDNISIKLNTKTNLIKIVAINNAGILSSPITFSLFNEAPEKLPKLYVIGMGVNIFENEKMDLAYPEKDVNNVLDKFQELGHRYAKIIPKSLLNEEFTTENVRALKSLLNQADVNDELIIFYSGHGLFNEKLDYYLATSKMDFNKPSEKGVAYEELEKLLDGIPARKKVLFIDACNSGEIDKESVELLKQQNTIDGKVTFKSFNQIISSSNFGYENTMELMKELFVDLRNGTGTTVISSATGLQASVEGEEWNNGVFTYCLLKGLSQEHADYNKDGEIMVSEIQKYLQEQVPLLTGFKQKPTFRTENVINDWRIK